MNFVSEKISAVSTVKWVPRGALLQDGSSTNKSKNVFILKVYILEYNMKVILGQEVALQHQLLVCDMRFDVPSKPKRKFTPHLKV